MELIETTASQARKILHKGNRKITLDNGRVVKWINLNNETCFAEDKNNSGSLYNNEDVIFYINVPTNAKTIY